MTRTQIVRNVHGGIVQDVSMANMDLQIVVVDGDTDGIDSPALVDLSLDGRRCPAAVVEMPPVPLDELAGSDVEQACAAACDRGVPLP